MLLFWVLEITTRLEKLFQWTLAPKIENWIRMFLPHQQSILWRRTRMWGYSELGLNSGSTIYWWCDFNYASSLRLRFFFFFIFKWMNDTHVIRLLEVVNEITQDSIWLSDYFQRATWRKEWGKKGKRLLLVHCPRHSFENELLRSNNKMLKKTIQETIQENSPYCLVVEWRDLDQFRVTSKLCVSIYFLAPCALKFSC